MLAAAPQASGVRASAQATGLLPLLDRRIDRRGLDVVVLAWEKPVTLQSIADE